MDAAREAFDKGRWPRMAPAERASLIMKLADLIEKEIDRLALLETQQQGKPIKLSRDSDFPFAIDNIRFFAGAARCLEGRASTEYNAVATSIIRRGASWRRRYDYPVELPVHDASVEGSPAARCR